MAQLELIPTTVAEGVWHGMVHTDATDTAPPEIRVTHLERDLPDVSLTHEGGGGGWHLTFPLPPQILSDGVQTILITDAHGTRLGTFAIAMGDALEGDIRAEVDLLRAELDMLKRAFRRHCVETG